MEWLGYLEDSEDRYKVDYEMVVKKVREIKDGRTTKT